MTYTIKYNDTKKVVILSIIGLIKISASLNILREMVQIGRENECRLFILNGNEVVVQDNFIEVYTFFDNLELYLRKHSDKLAIVFKKQKNMFNFIDSVAINHGFMLKSFCDNEKAHRWLNFKNPPHFYKYK